MATNITSTGNITIGGNAVINSDNTKSTIINGSLTVNNDENINGNLNVSGITNVNTLNISDVFYTNGEIKLKDNDVYFKATPNQYLGSYYDLKMYANTNFIFYLNNVEKFKIDQNEITTPNNIICNNSYINNGYIANIFSDSITNTNTVKTNKLELYDGINLSSITGNTMEIRSNANINMYINGIQKFMLNSQYLYTPLIKFYDDINITSANGNSLIMNSNSEIVMFSNGVEKCRVNNNGVNTTTLTCNTINFQNGNLTGNIITTGDVTANLIKSNSYQLNYGTSFPNYSSNTIGYFSTLNIQPTYITSNAVRNLGSISLSTGIWMVHIAYKINQFYNIENSIYTISISYGNTISNIIDFTRMSYLGSLITNEYFGESVFHIDNYTTVPSVFNIIVKIHSNNYTDLQFTAKVKSCRIG